MEIALWIAGILFVIILIIWWKAFLILFAITAAITALVAAFLTWRVSVLKNAPGVIEIKEIKGEFHCTVHPSAYDRAGLLALHAPMFAYLLACVGFSGYVLTNQFDFWNFIGCIMLFPPVALVMKYSPKLEWFAKAPLERYAKKLTPGLRIPEFLIQSDLAGREMAKALSGPWSPSFTTRYFQRLEMEPKLLKSEKAQLAVIDEFREVGMHDLNLLANAEDHWKAVDALVKVASETAIALKDDQMKSDAAFLAKSLRNPEYSDLLEFRDFGELYTVMMAIQADAEKLLEGRLPAMSGPAALDVQEESEEPVSET